MSQCIERLYEDLAAVQRWSIENGLLHNNAKTHAMIIYRDHGRLPFHAPSAVGCSLKNLGLVIKNFNWLCVEQIWHFADVTPLATQMSYCVVL
jgi:hypothetical protein